MQTYKGITFRVFKCKDNLWRYEIPAIGVSSVRGYDYQLQAVSQAKNVIDMA